MKITSKQYAKFLSDISRRKDEEQDVLLKKIAKVIKKNRDEKKVKEIEKIFNDIEKRESGILEAIVYSGEKLNKDQLDVIKEKLAKKKNVSKNKVEISNVLDKRIKGGLLIKAENEIFDGTLDGKLKQLRKALV
ncbi:MAG: F0F1 ATP synthase subunit delta [Candidatus Moraniibacteriota bacterium]